jgi:hypothetical protein
MSWSAWGSSWGSAWGASDVETDNVFTRTREQLRDMVLRKLRVLGIDRTANSEEEEIVNEAIDLRLKELHRIGTLWWNVASSQRNLTVSNGVATVTAPGDMYAPISLHIRLNDQDYPVDLVHHRVYQEIGTKLDTGRPEVAEFIGGVFRLYPVPDQAYTAKLTYERIIQDTAANTAPDVPVSMLLWLKVLVAYDVADDFRVPEPRLIRLEREAKVAERNLRTLNTVKFETQPVPVEYF